MTEQNPILSSKQYQAKSLEQLKDEILNSRDEYVAVDTETTGLRWTVDRAFGIAFAWDDKSTFIRNGTFGIENIGTFMKDLYSSKDKTFIFHNAEFDCHMIRETYGVEAPENIIDTVRVSHMLDASTSNALKNWGEVNYGPAATYHEDLVADYIRQYRLKSYSHVPAEIMDPYAANDTVLTKALAYKYVPVVKKMVGKLFDLEHALIPVIMDMEREGILIDLDYIDDLQKRVIKRQRKLTDHIYKVVGKPIDIGSSKQLGDYFYYRLGIGGATEKEKQKNIPTTESGRLSTGEKALKGIKHPEGSVVAQAVLKWRELEKINNTYLRSYLKLEHKGRIHARWNACGTITGRFSGSDPNLMNIPKDDKIRRIFVPDTEFIDMDFSQIELKLMAHASGQNNMINAFVEGQDLHSYTAAQILNKPIEQIDKDGNERKVAKAIYFGVIYGIGTRGLAELAGIPVRAAGKYLNVYWESYPNIKNYFDKQKTFAEENGYVKTMFGRHIPVKDRFYAAPNYIIQGTAGDIIKLSLFKTWKYAKSVGGSLRNTIHDQILFDNMDVSHAQPIKEIMEDYTFSMPVTVDVKTSKKSWGDLYDDD